MPSPRNSPPWAARGHRALRAALLSLEEAVDDPRALSIAKLGFYEVLVSGIQNGELKQMLDAINRRVTLVRAVSLSAPDRPHKSVAEVQAICAAAVAGDGETTERLCREHVENAAKTAFPRLAEAHGGKA
jgi:DNA-binding GntR family transcriptional regulator